MGQNLSRNTGSVRRFGVGHAPCRRGSAVRHRGIYQDHGSAGATRGRGAEQLSGLLNDCFAILTDVVDAHGGDIISFTGDGFLALWDIADPALASCLAAQCALALRDAMSAWALSSNSQFRQRICVDFGTVYFCKLGGYGNAWRYVVVGTPFHGLGSAYQKARVGQILLCESAWQPIVEHCDGEIIHDVLELRRLKNAPRSKSAGPAS